MNILVFLRLSGRRRWHLCKIFKKFYTKMQVIPEIIGKKKTTANVLWSLRQLYLVSRLLGIMPYRDDNNNFVPLHRSDTIYGYFIMCLVISGMSLWAVARILYTYGTMVLSMIILDFSISLLQLILVLMSLRCTITGHRDKVESFFIKLAKIDKIFSMIPKNYERLRRRIYIKCVGITVVTLMFAAAETFLWSKLNSFFLGVLGTYFVKYWMLYYKFIIFFQIQTRVDLLKERFHHVNQILSCNLNDVLADKERLEDDIMFQEISRSTIIKNSELHTVFEIHNSLCDMVDMVNDIHGFQILIIICSIIVAILNLLNTSIILILSSMFAEDQADLFGTQCAAVGIQAVLCFGFVIMSILMAAQCSSTVDEANQTKTIAQKLLLEEPAVGGKTNNDHYMYRDELVLFISTSRSPAFSAGGFFPVDYTLLLAIMGAVTSYFIVLLQFASVKGNKIV